MRRAWKRNRRIPPSPPEMAFACLFQKGSTRAAVEVWLGKLGVHRQDRKDVAQEVFLAAHQSFHTYDPTRARPERWLNRITVHVAARFLERVRRRREEPASDDMEDRADEQPSADEWLAQEQTRADILGLVHTLDERLRRVLIAYELEGVPMSEIAGQESISLSNAYKLRAKALRRLRRMLVQRDSDEGNPRPPPTAHR